MVVIGFATTDNTADMINAIKRIVSVFVGETAVVSDAKTTRANDSFEEVSINLHNYRFCKTTGERIHGVQNVVCERQTE